MESTTEITAWDPPNEQGRKLVGGPMPWDVRMKLERKENGTQLNLLAQMEIRGFFKIAEWLVSKQVKKQVDTDLEALKHQLEAGQA
jgi:hypothetical protein